MELALEIIAPKSNRASAWEPFWPPPVADLTSRSVALGRVFVNTDKVSMFLLLASFDSENFCATSRALPRFYKSRLPNGARGLGAVYAGPRHGAQPARDDKKMVASTADRGWSPLMQLLAEICVVIGVMLPGITTVILEVSSHRLLSAIVWTNFSVGLGLVATGILMLRRSLLKLLAEIFIIIGAMLPGIATVILEMSLNRPLSVLVAASLSVGSGLVAGGILVLRRQK